MPKAGDLLLAPKANRYYFVVKVVLIDSPEHPRTTDWDLMVDLFDLCSHEIADRVPFQSYFEKEWEIIPGV